MIDQRSGKAKTASQVGQVLAERARERMADPRAIWGIPWPFDGLNKLTGGIHKGELTILSARPSVGKTTIMVQCADTVNEYLKSAEGRKEYGPGYSIKLVLCESSAEVFMRRWACLRSGVSQRRVQEGRITQEQYDRFVTELKALARMPIEILDNARSLDEILNFLGSGKTAWWALDYVQKCPLGNGKVNDGSVGPITILSGSLTEAARRIAPGLLLAHTPRDVDKREDRRPRMGDIKGGSALEGDARVVLGLYRDDIYTKVPEAEINQPRPSELLLLKQNEGDSNRTVDLLFFPKKGMFQDVSQLFEEEDD